MQCLIVNILRLATELCCGKVFFMGATLWRSFLLLGLRECSALLGEDYERANYWITILPFLWCFKKWTRWRSYTVYGTDVVVEFYINNKGEFKYYQDCLKRNRSQVRLLVCYKRILLNIWHNLVLLFYFHYIWLKVQRKCAIIKLYRFS